MNITCERSISPSTKRFSASSALWASFTETKATRIMVRADARVPMAKTSSVPRENQWYAGSSAPPVEVLMKPMISAAPPALPSSSRRADSVMSRNMVPRRMATTL